MNPFGSGGTRAIFPWKKVLEVCIFVTFNFTPKLVWISRFLWSIPFFFNLRSRHMHWKCSIQDLQSSKSKMLDVIMTSSLFWKKLASQKICFWPKSSHWTSGKTLKRVSAMSIFKILKHYSDIGWTIMPIKMRIKIMPVEKRLIVKFEVLSHP